ncbi:MAG TPA: hypothetical protein VHW23_47845 [Kofleriaceae bacterium]|jgi:hypothetical protein|nr:hypothetical protein [Kofleriaceae bacterium]
MTPSTRLRWPSDDQLREQHEDEQFTEDGRKLTASPRVGGLAPDADPDAPPPAAQPTRR